MVDITNFFEDEVNREIIVFLVIIHLVILLTSLVGNTTLCLVVGTSKELRAPVDIYLSNLSMANVFTSLLGSFLVDNVMMNWTNGKTVCTTVLYGIQTCFITVNLTLTAVSFERYYCACKPSNYRGNILKRPSLVCITCWVLAALLSIPVLFLTNVRSNDLNSSQHDRICVTIWPPTEHWQVYFTVLTCAFYLLPLIAMFCLQRRTLSKLKEPQSTRSGGNRILNQSRQQVLYIIMIITVLNFVLFFPHEIILILHYFNVNISRLRVVWFIVTIFQFTPSALTSYICLVKYKPLRKNLNELFSCFGGNHKSVENTQI